MRTRTACIALAVALAMCASAQAGERAPGFDASRAVADERLEALRAGVAPPAGLQQAGVTLWDEPRKSPPPPRNAAGEGGGAALTATVTYQR